MSYRLVIVAGGFSSAQTGVVISGFTSGPSFGTIREIEVPILQNLHRLGTLGIERSAVTFGNEDPPGRHRMPKIIGV